MAFGTFHGFLIALRTRFGDNNDCFETDQLSATGVFIMAKSQEGIFNPILWTALPYLRPGPVAHGYIEVAIGRILDRGAQS